MSEITQNVWEEILEEFAFKAPSVEYKKGFADVIIPLDKDVLIAETKKLEIPFNMPEGLSVHNIQDKEQEENAALVLDFWRTYYTDVIREGKARLDFTSKNVDKEGKRVHKLLILDGVDDILKQYYGTNFSGLLYNSGIKEDKFGKVYVDFGYGSLDKQTKEKISLFSYGLEEANLHILTDQQLNFLLIYLPTLQSIVDYLNWKEYTFSSISIMSVDEYTMLLLYFLAIFKGKKQLDIMIPFEDKAIVEFVESDLSKKLLNSTSIFQDFLRYTEGNSTFKQHYLLFNLKSVLLFTEQLSDLIFTDYSEYSSRTAMFYQGRNLYLFHNVDDRISDSRFRTVYSGHFISAVSLEYIEKLKSELEIDNIICCVMHRTEENALGTTFIAINIKEILGSEVNLKEIREYAAEGVSVGWLPDMIDLSQLLEQKRDEIRELIPEQKGGDRNKPCPCGSGKKYKKCCGKFK